MSAKKIGAEPEVVGTGGEVDGQSVLVLVTHKRNEKKRERGRSHGNGETETSHVCTPFSFFLFIFVFADPYRHGDGVDRGGLRQG